VDKKKSVCWNIDLTQKPIEPNEKRLKINKAKFEYEGKQYEFEVLDVVHLGTLPEWQFSDRMLETCGLTLCIVFDSYSNNFNDTNLGLSKKTFTLWLSGDGISFPVEVHGGNYNRKDNPVAGPGKSYDYGYEVDTDCFFACSSPCYFKK